MSDELLALQHKRALEILQEPGQKKYMEERAKKAFNIIALKEWEEAGEPFEEDDEILAYFEYKKSEARKNGANPETVEDYIRTESAGAGRHNSISGGEQTPGSMYGVYSNKDVKTRKGKSLSTPGAGKQPSSTKYKNDKHRGKTSGPKRIPSFVNVHSQHA